MDPLDILISRGFYLDQSLGKSREHALAYTSGLTGDTIAFDSEGDVWICPSARILPIPFQYKPELSLFGASTA